MIVAYHVIICGVFGLFLISLLVIGVIHNIITQIRDAIAKKLVADTNDNTSTDIRILIHVNLCLILMNMILLLFRFLFINIFVDKWYDGYCILPNQISMSIFQLTRTTMYIIFIRRIQVVFADTIFQLKHKYIHILYGMIAVYILPYISYFNWTLLFASSYDQIFSCSISFNVHPYQPILFWFLSLMDLSISLCCLYLFVSPFYQLLQHQNDKEIKNQLSNVMIKYSILQSTAIISAFILIMLSFSLSFGYYYVMIDGLINGMMLILLHPLHNICYKRICCVLHKCCLKCCTQMYIYQKKTSPTPIQERLEPININTVPEHSEISDVTVETPMGLLLAKSIDVYIIKTAGLQNGQLPVDNNHNMWQQMYRNAANAEPSFDIKSKNINTKLKSGQAKISKPQEPDGNIDGVTDVQKAETTLELSLKVKVNGSKLNLDISRQSSQASLSKLSTASNTLHFIQCESTHL